MVCWIPCFFKNCLDSAIRVVAAAKDLSKNPVCCGNWVWEGMCWLSFSEAEKECVGGSSPCRNWSIYAWAPIITSADLLVKSMASRGQFSRWAGGVCFASNRIILYQLRTFIAVSSTSLTAWVPILSFVSESKAKCYSVLKWNSSSAKLCKEKGNEVTLVKNFLLSVT